jgi:hypothetical protein
MEPQDEDFLMLGHVVGCHDQSVGGRQLWHWEIVGGKLKCIDDAFTGRGRDVHVLTSVMMNGWDQGISMLPVGCPSLAFSWFFVCNDFASGRCKRCFVVIHQAMEVCRGRQLGMQSRGPQEIQSDFRLG